MKIMHDIEIICFREFVVELTQVVCIFPTGNLKLHRHCLCPYTDEIKKDDDNNHCNRDEVSAQDVSLDPCKPNKRGLRKAQVLDPRDRFVQPSCPTKKRIQVPQHPPFTAPIRSESANDGSALIVGNKAKNSLDAISQKTEQVFQPFFWLRDDEDDDADKGSQYSDKDQLTDSSPFQTPCFSDIKDAEDNVAVNSMAVVCTKIDMIIIRISNILVFYRTHD